MDDQHCNERCHQTIKLQTQKFDEQHEDDDLNNEDRYVYEPLEDFSKVYEKVDPNEESDITTNTVNETDGKSDITNIVNKMDGKSPPSNQESDVTSAVSVTDDKVAVPIESLQVPAGSNDHISMLYEELSPQETMSAAGTGDLEGAKKMESSSLSTKKQALICNSESNNYKKEPTTDDNPACEATTAL